MLPARSIRLETPRLLLRPSEPGDAATALAIRSNWNVARNLSRATFPPDRQRFDDWFATHEAEWRDGTAFRFAILHRDGLIGIIDFDEIAAGEGELGYWLDEAAWGQGFGFEAARAIVAFGFEQAGLAAIRAGRAADNPASGRILQKLGFHHIGDVVIASRPRGQNIVQCRYRLERGGATGKRA